VSYTLSGVDGDAAATVRFSDGNAAHDVVVGGLHNGTTTVNLSGLSDGPITASVSATDTAGNSASGAGDSSVKDTTADAGGDLAVTINDGDGYVNASEKSAVSYTLGGVDGDAAATVRFSDGNAAHDVVVGGLHNGTTTVNLSGLSDGPITASVSATDTAGNSASGAGDSSVKDTASPTLTSVALQSPATSPTNADSLVFRVTFSEAVTGVDATDFVVSGSTATVSAVSAVSAGVYDVTLSGGNLATLNGVVGLALKSIGGGATVQDLAGNALTNFTTTGTSASYTVDNTADSAPLLTLASVTSSTGNSNFTAVNLTVSGFDADLTSATITLTDEHSHTATHTLTAGELATATSSGQVAIGTWTNVTSLAKNDVISVTISVGDVAGNSASHSGSFQKQGLITAPAGAAGEPIELALFNPQAHTGSVTVHLSDVPSGWSLSEGTLNSDGTWTVQTDDPSGLKVTSPADFVGAVALKVSMQWTNADGTTQSTLITDNVEAYAPGSPIFAVSSDDHLTASSAPDLLVFAQPIAHDTIHNFDASNDTIDLIGFGAAQYSDLQIADDANGNAVVTLASGSTITVDGVHSADLGASNFVFNVEPTTANPGTMTISDGAILPLGGVIDNTGTIALQSTGSETNLEILAESVTLQGGGHVTLSDNDNNVIFGGASNATLINADNTISGAGQIGAGQMTLVNAGTIVADGSHALVIDTGANTVVNTGTLAATGTGGLVVSSDVDNTGVLSAQGGTIAIHGDVSGHGSADIAAAGSIEFSAASDANVAFATGTSGTLTLDDSAHFTGTLAGLTGDDGLHLADIAFGAQTQVSYTANAAGSAGTLHVSDGVHQADIALIGNYAAGDFQLQAAQDGSTQVAVAPGAAAAIVGTAGAGVISGTSGNDIIVAGAGADVMSGGAGSDTFYFRSSDAGAVHTITDFDASAGGDRIDLAALLHGYAAGDDLSQYVGLHESGGNTVVSIDADGAGSAHGFQDLVVLSGVTGLDLQTLLAHVDTAPLS
jgi:hypothetical protein